MMIVLLETNSLLALVVILIFEVMNRIDDDRLDFCTNYFVVESQNWKYHRYRRVSEVGLLPSLPLQWKKK